jgi:hypothetical protein
VVKNTENNAKSVKIDNETYKKLQEYKDKNYIPIGKIIKLAVENFINKKGN